MISPMKPSSICVVDPCRADYAALIDQAPAEGADVAFAASAREALRLRPTDPEMWLVNFDLPDLSGLELVDMLRAKYPDTPICIVANDYDPQSELAARRRGASMYVCKPIVAEWLLEPRMSVCH